MTNPEQLASPPSTIEINALGWGWRALVSLDDHPAAHDVAHFFDYFNGPKQYTRSTDITEEHKKRISRELVHAQNYGDIEFLHGNEFFEKSLRVKTANGIAQEVSITDYQQLQNDVNGMTGAPLRTYSRNDPRYYKWITRLLGDEYLHESHESVKPTGPTLEEFKEALLVTLEKAVNGELYTISHSNPSARSGKKPALAIPEIQLIDLSRVGSLNSLIDAIARCRTETEKRTAAANFLSYIRQKPLKDISETYRLMEIVQNIEF